MADERTYIKVHDGIEDHPKIMVLSDKAFRVLVTTWGWSSRHTTDGFVPDAVWNKRATPKVRKELGAALVHKPGHECDRCPAVPPGHVRMHDFLEHQRSAGQIEEKREAKRRAGRFGNHKRWHDEQGIVADDCEFCLVPKGSQVRSQGDRTGSSQGDRKKSPEVEVEVDKEKEVGDYQRNPPPARGTETPPTPRCPQHVNRRAIGPCGPCADARRAREAWDRDLAEAERLAIARCRLCDGDGRRWDPVSKARGTVGPCDHQPIPRQETA